MKKQLLFTFGGMLMTLACFSQAKVVPLVNPSFELPADSIKIPCSTGYVAKGSKDTIAFNKIPGFGWKIDLCNDAGREDPKKFGGIDAGLGKQAFDGWHVMYTHHLAGHFYQVVEKVKAGDKYILSGETIYSYSDVDSSYSGVYFSLFSGTDTTNRTIVAGDSTLWDNTAGDAAAWTLVTTGYTIQAADAGKTLAVEFGCSAVQDIKASTYTYFYDDSITLTKTAGPNNGVKESNLSNLSVYPNPSTGGLFNLRNVSTGTASVYDLTGKLVYSQNIANLNQIVNLSSQNSGIYILKVVTENSEEIRKLVIR
jgi:hypothetical protein